MVNQSKSKVLSFVLYTDKHLMDLKRFPLLGQLGKLLSWELTKPKILGPCMLTPTVFKHLGVVGLTTGDHPIFLGSVFVHGNSDYLTYASFFHHIADRLDCPGNIII